MSSSSHFVIRLAKLDHLPDGDFKPLPQFARPLCALLLTSESVSLIDDANNQSILSRLQHLSQMLLLISISLSC